MSRSFLELLSDLNEASGKTVSAISDNLSALLEEDDSYTNQFLYHILSHVVYKNFDKSYIDFVETDFCDVQVRSYMDEDFKTRIAINFTFLQDYENHSDDLDGEVMNDLVSSLNGENLSLLVNDISVNVIQVRNGRKVAYDLYNQ